MTIRYGLLLLTLILTIQSAFAATNWRNTTYSAASCTAARPGESDLVYTSTGSVYNEGESNVTVRCPLSITQDEYGVVEVDVYSGYAYGFKANESDSISCTVVAAFRGERRDSVTTRTHDDDDVIAMPLHVNVERADDTVTLNCRLPKYGIIWSYYARGVYEAD